MSAGGGPRGVDDPAVAPDLSLCPGQHLGLPHLEHGPGELGPPRRLAAREGVDERLRRRVGHQRRVRREEAQVVLQADVVLAVELGRRDEVHERRGRREGLVAAGRADAPEQKCVGIAQRRINL